MHIKSYPIPDPKNNERIIYLLPAQFAVSQTFSRGAPLYTVLYVDDEPGLLEITKLFLESGGEFSIDTRLSAQDGLQALRDQAYDAVVSDFQMPGMDGIGFLKSVRSEFGNIPFILFTGRGREEVVIEAINNGADYYLQKGGDPRAQFMDLAHKIRQTVQQRQVEASIRDHERRVSDILNFLPDATFAIDTKGIIIAWNRAMERMTGIDASAILGKGNFAYSIPFYHERRPILIDLILHDNPATVVRYPFIKREGKTLFSEIIVPLLHNNSNVALWFTASPLYDKNGVIVGAIESVREITERKRVEDALRQANRQLTLLTSITRHDIRNQIMGIIGYLSLAEMKSTDPALSDYFRKIESAITVIQSLITDSQEYQKVGQGAPVWQDLTRLLNIAEKGIIPGQVDIKNDLPAGTEIFADPMLEKVFFNLLDNSIRHGQRVTEVRISSCHAGRDLVVFWEDNGIGIAADEKERIFERGFGRNTGLGLFLVRDVLSLTGITIKETGIAGKGVRFEIIVPKGGYRFSKNQQV